MVTWEILFSFKKCLTNCFRRVTSIPGEQLQNRGQLLYFCLFFLPPPLVLPPSSFLDDQDYSIHPANINSQRKQREAVTRGYKWKINWEEMFRHVLYGFDVMHIQREIQQIITNLIHPRRNIMLLVNLMSSRKKKTYVSFILKPKVVAIIATIAHTGRKWSLWIYLVFWVLFKKQFNGYPLNKPSMEHRLYGPSLENV